MADKMVATMKRSKATTPKESVPICRITWCGEPSNGNDGWCWTHMVIAHLNNINLEPNDAARVREALYENR